MTELPMIEALIAAAKDGPAGELLAGLFGPTRRLYKRLAELSYYQSPELYARIARRPYPWLAACSAELAERASRALGTPISPNEILIDAPPVGLEVEFKVEIYYPKERRYRTLGEVSPVVQTLASRQFDDFVKRVRVFAHPRIAAELKNEPRLMELLGDAVANAEG
jgi:hypothetical protein